MSTNALYTDLSAYYDLMCADINYQAQSHCVSRLNKLLGNEGLAHLDLACGTGPHLRHFIDYGFQCSGLDLHQKMLDRAIQRCPEALFSLQNISDFSIEHSVDLITCLLYSIHYNESIERLKACIVSVHKALNSNGVFCFNAVDKNTINSDSFTEHSVKHEGSHLTFRSGWNYCGTGARQSLKLCISKTDDEGTQQWHDEHTMVAFEFSELQAILAPYFEVHVFQHDYEKILPWDMTSGNAIFVCVKR